MCEAAGGHAGTSWGTLEGALGASGGQAGFEAPCGGSGTEMTGSDFKLSTTFVSAERVGICSGSSAERVGLCSAKGVF